MVETDPRTIAPSQNFLKEKTVRFIFECIRDGKEDELPPEPIIREDREGGLVTIDGHNLLAVRVFLNESQKVHIARNSEDGLPKNSEANLTRNKYLRNKFETCLNERDITRTNGVKSFDDLIKKYRDLFKEAAL